MDHHLQQTRVDPRKQALLEARFVAGPKVGPQGFIVLADTANIVLILYHITISYECFSTAAYETERMMVFRLYTVEYGCKDH